MLPLSVIVRCSEDLRVVDCLDSIDAECEVIGAITPDARVQAELERRQLRYAVSPRGNPAATTLAALPLASNGTVVLIDSDCRFAPGAVRRLAALSQTADIVRPNIHFAADGPSSRATAIARTFQYTYCGFIYEPGLVVNLDRVVAAAGGYLFAPDAPFTPDGELDFRLRHSGAMDTLSIVTDPEVTLTHAPLSISRHFASYWRYGLSEATRMAFLGQPVLRTFLASLPARYRAASSRPYPRRTVPIIAGCDTVYVVAMLVNYLRLKAAA
ncbi:MAG TPA: hypothetical protein VEO54_11125 [Thermoanaerobaculia bacterium]|nr:hypothetical protein [Thermoanaerobaculia bacterium]